MIHLILCLLMVFCSIQSVFSMKRAAECLQESQGPPIKRNPFIYLRSRTGAQLALPRSVAFLSEFIKVESEKKDPPIVTLRVSDLELSLLVKCLRDLEMILFQGKKMTFAAMANTRLIESIQPLVRSSDKFEFMDLCITLKIDCLAHFIAHYCTLEIPTYRWLNPQKDIPDLEEEFEAYEARKQTQYDNGEIKKLPALDTMRRLFTCYKRNRANIKAYEKTLWAPHLPIIIYSFIESMPIEQLIEFVKVNDFLGIMPLKEAFVQLIILRDVEEKKRLRESMVTSRVCRTLSAGVMGRILEKCPA